MVTSIDFLIAIRGNRYKRDIKVPFLEEVESPVIVGVPRNKQTTDAHQLPLLVKELLQLLLTGREDTDNKTKLVREGVTHS